MNSTFPIAILNGTCFLSESAFVLAGASPIENLTIIILKNKLYRNSLASKAKFRNYLNSHSIFFLISRLF